MESYPLKIFDELLERKGIDKCYERFLANAQMLDGIFLNKERTEFCCYEVGQFGENVSFSENFGTYLNKIFIEAYDDFCKKVSVQLSTITTTHDQKEKVSFYLAQLNRLGELFVSDTALINRNIAKWIKRAKTYLVEKYPAFVPPEYLNPSPDNEELFYEGVDYFEFKLPNNHLKGLYDKLITLGLFTDETSYQDFRNWITASKPHNDPKIKFATKDQESAYIIERMKKFFASMTDLKVQKFNLFISNKERPIKSNNLQRNRHAFLSNPSNEERKIQIETVLL